MMNVREIDRCLQQWQMDARDLRQVPMVPWKHLLSYWPDLLV